jgi:hypothetical protein
MGSFLQLNVAGTAASCRAATLADVSTSDEDSSSAASDLARKVHDERRAGVGSDDCRFV